MGSKRKTTEGRAFRAAVDESKDGSAPGGIIELSNGIRLRVQRVAPLAIREATLRVEKPRPPKVLIEEKGREEENPADPDYLRELEEYEEATGLAAVNVVLLKGTSIEHVPEGMSRLEDGDWVEDCQFLGIEFDAENPRARYLAWLRFYAICSDADLLAVLGGLRQTSGVREEDVAKAAESFRGGEARGADSGGPPEGGG